MTSPERDPRVVLRAEVTAYVAAMDRARVATSRMAAQTAKDLGRVEAAYATAGRAAAAYAEVTTRANATVAASSARTAAAANSAAFNRAAKGAAAAGIPYGPITATQAARAEAAALERDIARTSAEAAAIGARARSQSAAASAAAARTASAADAAAARSARDLAAAEEAAAARRVAAIRSVAFGVGLASLAIIAGLAASAKAAIKWESDWTGVTKTVHGSAGQMKTIESQLRGMAKVLPATASEIATTAAAAGQLGVATPFIVNFTRTAIQLGATTSMSAEEASTGLAKLMNIMGAAGTQIGRYGSTLIALENAGAGTAKDLLNMSIRLAGAGRVAGLTADQVMSLAGAMTNVGIRSELGGSSMQRVLLKMFTAVDQGGPKLAAFAKYAQMGFGGATLTADQFAEKFRTKPVEALKLVLQGLHNVQASGKGFTLALADMGIKTSQDVRTLSALAVSNDKVNKTLEDGAVAWQKNLALLAAAEKRFATTHSQIQIAKNQIHDTAISFGQELLPAIGGVAGGIGGIGEELGKLPGWAREALVVLGSTAGAVGLLGLAAVVAIPRLLEFRAALAASGSSGAAFSKGLGIATAAIIALTYEHKAINKLDESLDKMFNRSGDASQFRAAAVEFAQSGKLIGEAARLMGEDFRQLAEDQDRVLNPSKFDQARGVGEKIAVGLAPMAAIAEKVTEKVLHLDNALTSSSKRVAFYDEQWQALAQSGGMDEVQKNLDGAAAKLRASGKSDADVQSALAKLYPKTTAAMLDQATAAKVGGDAMTGLGNDAAGSADGVDAATTSLAKFKTAISDLEEHYFGTARAQDEVRIKLAAINAETVKTATGTDYLGGAVDKTKVSIDTAGAAADAYASKLAGMRGETDDTTAGMFDADRAADAMQSALHDLTGDTNDTTAAVTSLGDAIDAAFGNSDAVDAFDSQVAAIKKRIAEGPGEGIRIDLTLEGSTDAARTARAEVEELVKREADLANRDVIGGTDPTVAMATRRAELERTMRDIGYADDAITSTLGKLDQIPVGVLGAANKAGSAISVLSHELNGNTQAAIDNRNKLRDLIESAADDIASGSKGMTAGQVSALVAKRRADLRAALTADGFDGADVDPYLSKLKAPDAASKTLVGNSKAAIDNRDAVRDLISTTKDMIDQDLHVGMSKKQVTAVVERHTARLNDDLRQMGYNVTEASKLEAGLRGIPDAYMSSTSAIKDNTDAAAKNNETVIDLFDSMAKYLAQTAVDHPEQFAAVFNAQRTALAGVIDKLHIAGSIRDDLLSAFDELPGTVGRSVSAAISAVDSLKAHLAAKPGNLRSAIDAMMGDLRSGVASAPPLSIGIHANSPDLGAWRNDVQKNFDTWPLRLSVVPTVNTAGQQSGFTFSTGNAGGVGVFKPPGRAAGGPVWAGESYTVGEHGPERLVMGDRSGRVIPNHRAFGDLNRAPAPPAPAPVVTVHAPSLDAKELAALIRSQPIVLNVDGRQVALALGAGANARTRTR